MEGTRLLASIRNVTVIHVRRFFNPSGFDSKGFRGMITLGLMGVMLGELVVYILLKQSADLGELPHYIPDALIIGISALEFLLGPFIGWLGASKRRRVMVMWVSLALVCTLPLFGLPSPEITPDAGLCSAGKPLTFAVGISPRAAVRLSLLLVSGLAFALARLAILAHSLAYLNEFNPSDNLYMHVGIFLIHKILVLLIGNIAMKSMTQDTQEIPWMQVLIITIKFLVTLLRLHRYPVSAPAPMVEKHRGRERSLFRSIGRVLSSPIAMLQTIAMALLAAAFWGFGMHEEAFVKAKYRIVTNFGGHVTIIINLNLFYLPVILGVILAGYMYTGPVMPKFDRKAAVRNAATMSLLSAVVYVLMTAWLSCNGGMAGLNTNSYNQPACGQNCGCDRPWMQLTPVCVPEQMATYFSPCHAGCAMADTLNGISEYSNCTCAPGGRVMVGACDDGSCAETHSFHQLLFVAATLTSSLALVWQITVVIESVDRRDVAVAMGFASGVVSLFAFVSAHAFYFGISFYTCAFNRGSKCLLQNNQFAPWVGYSSATLASLSMLFSVITFVVLKRQKKEEPKDSSENLFKTLDSADINDVVSTGVYI